MWQFVFRRSLTIQVSFVCKCGMIRCEGIRENQQQQEKTIRKERQTPFANALCFPISFFLLSVSKLVSLSFSEASSTLASKREAFLRSRASKRCSTEEAAMQAFFG